MSKLRLAEGTLNPIAIAAQKAQMPAAREKQDKPRYPTGSQILFIIVIWLRRRFSILVSLTNLQIPPDFATSYPI